MRAIVYQYFILPTCRPRSRPRTEAERRWNELFKTKKEERAREVEVIKNVFSPAVEMVYRGHRNSRTMVRGVLCL